MERDTEPVAIKMPVKLEEENEIECAFCMEFPIKPIKLKCSHVYCYYCITEYLNFGKQNCPMCRKEIDPKDIEVDKKLNKKMKEKYPEKYASRLKEIKEISKDLVVIKIGNTHKLLAIEENNKHKWKCFVLFPEEVEKKIDYVVFNLHETFKVPIRKVDKAPFEIKSIGWGYFTIKIEVVFKKSTGIKNMKLEHELCFDGNGTSNVIKRPLAYFGQGKKSNDK